MIMLLKDARKDAKPSKLILAPLFLGDDVGICIVVLDATCMKLWRTDRRYAPKQNVRFLSSEQDPPMLTVGRCVIARSSEPPE